MGFLSFLTGLTPGGVVGEASAKVASGIFDGLGSLIDKFHLSPEQEIQAKLEIEKQRLEFYKAQTADVSSARQMQMTTRSLWPGILSATIMIGYFCALYELFSTHGPIDPTSGSGTVLLMLIQTLNVAVGMVLQFWLGSSSSSQDKTAMLYNSSPTPTGGSVTTKEIS